MATDKPMQLGMVGLGRPGRVGDDDEAVRGHGMDLVRMTHAKASNRSG